MRNTADAFLSEGEKGREMQYRKELFLKDGTPCVLRGATETDAAEVLRCFSLTHTETDFLLTYPEENSFTEADEAKFLKARSESENEIEICAFVDGKLAGTAGIEAIGGKEKIRHRAEFGIAIEKAYWGRGIGKALMLACIECAKKWATCSWSWRSSRTMRPPCGCMNRSAFGSSAATPEASAQNMAGRSSCSCGWSWTNKTSAPPKGRALLRKTS